MLDNLKGSGKPLKRRGHEVAGLGGVGGTAQMLGIMAEAKVKPLSLERLDELKVTAASFRLSLATAIAESGKDATDAQLSRHVVHSAAAGPRTAVTLQFTELNVQVDKYNAAVLADLLTYQGRLPLAQRQPYNWDECVAEAKAAVAKGPEAVTALAKGRFEGMGTTLV